MAHDSSTRGAKRKMAASFPDPSSRSFKVSLLSSSLLLLEIPPGTNTSLPVWDAIRSQQVDISWTVEPYSISVHFTPVTSTQGKSTTSGESTSVAETSALPSVILNPQIQPTTQGNGTSPNTSCVLISLPKNSTQFLLCPPRQPQATPPKSGTVMPTQAQPAHQLSIPKMQALSKTPVPSPFHTKNSSEVRICDRFLLNMCQEGDKCKMHHTPFPFHWQLWCVTTHQWVSISTHSQVLLERIYCDVSHDVVHINDGNVHYSLNLDSMELDDSSKYDAVRRLTTSDKNPYFPSTWKTYWWNGLVWKEYNKNVSNLLLRKMREKKSECFFQINAQEYKLDFTRMTQIHVNSGLERRVRCRPIYRSPESMLPYLHTGIITNSPDATRDPPGANFSVDPLEEFSSWYPPVWCLPSEDDYKLVTVPAGTQAYCTVRNLFCEGMPETKVDIISIQQVQNLLHWDKYQRHKAHMQKQNTKSKEPLERHLFHGTTEKASRNICHNNFDPRVAGVNGASNGFGSYFATTASYSNSYSAKEGPAEIRHMFLAKVLVGRVCLGKHNYRRPPPVTSMKKHYCLYDSCVDNMEKPTMFVVFDSCQCYPYYLIKYRDIPKEIDI
ncbi:protein mono-ADP-ribosyltransferase TIPARP-like isoform X2 [Anabas testudineus]|uniref:Poly [ADP-ribose] polymerase n=2 Tax=Anabas testudineus TaxID=64144 RepID=A0A7N6F7B8_ANATE|nr:protein mono-ADP-ribosyltransferase TIPARP-like isoform X2 [Anabas testudineus]